MYLQIRHVCLRDPKNGLDQESKEVARGYYSMAKAIDRQTGDLLKAEKLASRLCSQDSERIGTCDSILSVILLIQGRVDHETKELIERTIAINTKHCGTDGANTASAYVKLATFYHKLSMTQHTN
jgi:hypothetical protein